jgi:hypothetical protein
MTTFTPPGAYGRAETDHPLWVRTSITRGVSLLVTDGVYTQVRDPSDEDLTAADAVYLGGHVYDITESEAANLAGAGYGDWIV